METMENEELFAGEAALDAQQQLVRNSRHTETTTALHVHHEPLLADDSDPEWTQDVHHAQDTDTRPAWRKPTVSI